MTLIERFGDAALVGIVVVIFIETGLLFPILPGDSLLFTAGALVAQESLQISLPVLLVLLFAAAFLGDQTAYLIGRTVGPKVFDRPDSRFFKRKYIDQTNAYFEKYGGRTIVIARFVPIVRTYAPVAAGVGKMHYRHFVGFNALGALLWAVGLTWLGYLLGTSRSSRRTSRRSSSSSSSCPCCPWSSRSGAVGGRRSGRWRWRRGSPPTPTRTGSRRTRPPSARPTRTGRTPDMTREITSWLTDMDGVLVHEGHAIPGAPEFVRALRDKGRPFLILTNNSIFTARDLRARSRRRASTCRRSRSGRRRSRPRSSSPTRSPGQRVRRGRGRLTTALYEAGYTLTESDPDYVVLGETRTYSFEAITKAIRLVLGGSRFICTNPDTTGPSQEGPLPPRAPSRR